jgi:myo-inositol-1(or 4)-monophosphatase
MYRDKNGMDEYLQMFRVMTEASTGLRRAGAAALDLAYVAAGRLDGFFEKGLKPWDMAAGSLLITESGGIVGTFAGESDYLYKGNVIAGTPKVFGQMVNLLAPFAK